MTLGSVETTEALRVQQAFERAPFNEREAFDAARRVFAFDKEPDVWVHANEVRLEEMRKILDVSLEDCRRYKKAADLVRRVHDSERLEDHQWQANQNISRALDAQRDARRVLMEATVARAVAISLGQPSPQSKAEGDKAAADNQLNSAKEWLRQLVAEEARSLAIRDAALAQLRKLFPVVGVFEDWKDQFRINLKRHHEERISRWRGCPLSLD
ncbi:MAG: hypothetical protein K2W95_24825 [Candidatus Obscuribacterales bacterium]|nr:hypothetical protein [Candidatus Obscuribacterales bacterium]